MIIVNILNLVIISVYFCHIDSNTCRSALYDEQRKAKKSLKKIV